MICFSLCFNEKVGEVLIKKKHHAKTEIHQSVQRLSTKWDELLAASANRGKGLEEAKDILNFMEQVDKVLTWIREKVSDIIKSIKFSITIYIF